MNLRFLYLRNLSPDGDGGKGGDPDFVAFGDIDAEEEQETPDPKKDDKPEPPEKEDEDEPQPDPEKDKTKTDKTEDAPADETDEDEEEPEEGSIWDDVEALRGESLEVDFGDTDPTSPEGILIYENAVRTDAMAKFESYLEQLNPRAYAYLLHVTQGGTEETFFEKAGAAELIYTDAELEGEDGLEKQKDIVTRDMKFRGMSDKVIAATIRSMIADDELEEAAKEANGAVTKRAADKVRETTEATHKEAQEKAERISQMSEYIGGVAATGKLGNVVIPEKDRKPFAQAVADSVRYENGKFVLVTEINEQNAIDVFKEKFFSYKNGNLEGLIEKQAAAANTRRLVRTLPNGGKKPLGKGKVSDEKFIGMGGIDD